MKSHPARVQTIRERVGAGILKAAAQVFAERGDRANLAEVAKAAGISQATLYRYFPKRESLLEELASLALLETGERLSAARLEHVAVGEGISRAVRALIAVGDHYIVLAREHVRPDQQEFEQILADPLRALLERGQSEGALRADLPAAWLMELLLGLVTTALLSREPLGDEETVAAITSLFLDGCLSAKRS